MLFGNNSREKRPRIVNLKRDLDSFGKRPGFIRNETLMESSLKRVCYLETIHMKRDRKLFI